MITLKLSREQYEQLKVDLECAIAELTELSREVDWYVTDLPDRLTMELSWLEESKSE